MSSKKKRLQKKITGKGYEYFSKLIGVRINIHVEDMQDTKTSEFRHIKSQQEMLSCKLKISQIHRKTK